MRERDPDDYATLVVKLRGRNALNRKSTTPALTPDQAHYVLAQAVADRKLSYNDIVSYLARIKEDVRALEARLDNLRALTGNGIVSHAKRLAHDVGPKAVRSERRRAKRITPAHRASMKLQGQYLGLLRQLPDARKVQIKKLAQEKGREVAISMMRRELNR